MSQLNARQIFRREEEGKRQKLLKKFCPLFDKQVITSLLGQFWESFENTLEINPFLPSGPWDYIYILIIDHFTVVCLVAWPWNENSH